jgi:hypothetical protein
MRFWKEVMMVGVASLFWAAPIFVYAESCDDTSMEAGCTAEPSGYYDGYDDSQAHPLRILAYAVHPVGYAFEWLLTRPIHAIVSQPELHRVFGHQSHRWDFCCGMPQQTTPLPAPVPAPVMNTADVDAARRAAEEAKRAAEDAKRAAEEAARAAERSTRGFEKSLTK